MSALFTPQISIIVPVYNPPAPYLRECLDSICNQTLKDIEIILIDNGSIEDNPQILQDYAARDQRIKLIRFEENKGFSHACNTGISQSTSPYFQIVDSDDILSPHACQTELNILRKNHPDILVFNHCNYNCTTNKIEESPIYPQLQKNNVFKLNDDSSDLFMIPFCSWNKVYSKQFINAHHIQFHPQLTIAAPDCLFSAQAYVLAEKISYLPDYLYTYRYNVPNSIMSRIKAPKSNLYQQVFIFCQELEKFALRYSTPDKNKFLNKLYMEILLFNYSKIHSSNKRAYYHQMRKLLNSANPQFLVPEHLQCFNLLTQFNEIKQLPYWLYTLKHILFKHTPNKLKFGFFTIYKQKQKSTTTSHIFLSGLYRIDATQNATIHHLLGIKIFTHRQ